MSITVKEYADGGKVDTATSYGMAHAIAEAGKAWAASGDKSLEAAQRIAREAVKNEDMFLDKAGTKDLVVRYNEVLIERAGNNLTAYLDDVATAVQGVDFEKVKSGDLTGLNGKSLKDIKAAISASAKKNIGTSGTIEQDFIQTLKNDEQKPENEKQFKDVQVNDPQAMGGGLIGLIIQLIDAFLGIDLGSTFTQNPAAEKTELERNGVTFSPELEKKLNDLIPAATRLSEGKGQPGDMQAIAEFAGVQNAEGLRLTDEQKKTLADVTLADITKVRTGALSEEGMRTDIQKFTQQFVKDNNVSTGKAEQPSLPPQMIPLVGAVGAVLEGFEKVLSVKTFGLIDMDKVRKHAAEGMDKLAEMANPVNPDAGRGEPRDDNGQLVAPVIPRDNQRSAEQTSTR